MTMNMDQGAQCQVMHCDTCSEHLETDHIDWRAARDFAHEKGWRAYIGPDKKWAHGCPSCTADFAKRESKR